MGFRQFRLRDQGLLKGLGGPAPIACQKIPCSFSHVGAAFSEVVAGAAKTCDGGTGRLAAQAVTIPASMRTAIQLRIARFDMNVMAPTGLGTRAGNDASVLRTQQRKVHDQGLIRRMPLLPIGEVHVGLFLLVGKTVKLSSERE